MNVFVPNTNFAKFPIAGHGKAQLRRQSLFALWSGFVEGE